MTAPEAELRRAWHHLMGRGHEAPLDSLLAAHREPHRHYHTATHVMWVLRHIADIAEAQPVNDRAAVEAAALFHDAVYDPRSTTNERDSALLSSRVLSDAGWSSSCCAAVQRLILATAHGPVDSHEPDDHVLVDADLAILGSDPATYAAYATAVRSEFDHIDDAGWQRGRSAFVHRMLDRASIFHTPLMVARREARARANLTAEAAALARLRQ